MELSFIDRLERMVRAMPMYVQSTNESKLSQISPKFNNRNAREVAEILGYSLEKLRGGYTKRQELKSFLDFSRITEASASADGFGLSNLNAD